LLKAGCTFTPGVIYSGVSYGNDKTEKKHIETNGGVALSSCSNTDLWIFKASGFNKIKALINYT